MWLVHRKQSSFVQRISLMFGIAMCCGRFESVCGWKRRAWLRRRDTASEARTNSNPCYGTVFVKFAGFVRRSSLLFVYCCMLVIVAADKSAWFACPHPKALTRRYYRLRILVPNLPGTWYLLYKAVGLQQSVVLRVAVTAHNGADSGDQ